MSAEDDNNLDLDNGAAGSSTTPAGDPNTTRNNPLLAPSNPLVSDLEQEVLDEYARLLDNVNKLSSTLADLAGSPASLTLDGLRMLERKTATVYTLLKASVYSIVLQQQIINDGEAEAAQQNPVVGGSGAGGNGFSMFEGDDTVTH